MNEEPPDISTRIDRLIGKIDRLAGPKPEVPTAEEAPARSGPQFQTPRPALGVRCPQCNKRALRKAKRDTIFYKLALLVLFSPYRCRYCRYFEMRFMLEDFALRRIFGMKPKG